MARVSFSVARIRDAIRPRSNLPSVVRATFLYINGCTSTCRSRSSFTAQVSGPSGDSAGTRGFQLLGCVQLFERHQMAVGQLQLARDAFVDGMVDLEVLAFQVFLALAPGVEPDEEDPKVVLRAFAD